MKIYNYQKPTPYPEARWSRTPATSFPGPDFEEPHGPLKMFVKAVRVERVVTRSASCLVSICMACHEPVFHRICALEGLA